MLLSEKNAHPRDARITFRDDTHTYFVDGSSAGYISTTTLVHTLFPAFEEDVVIAKMMKNEYKFNQGKYAGMSAQEIKDAWKLNRDTAASLGTAMHANIEAYYNGLPHTTEGKEWDMFCAFRDDHPHLQPFRTEMTIFAEDVKIAGSIDMLYTDPARPGVLIMADWKRSKEIKTSNRLQKGSHPLTNHLDDCNLIHYSLQLAIYKHLLQEYYGFKIAETFILILHPNQDEYLKIHTRDVDDIVKAVFEERRKEIEDENKENLPPSSPAHKKMKM